MYIYLFQITSGSSFLYKKFVYSVLFRLSLVHSDIQNVELMDLNENTFTKKVCMFVHTIC